MRSDIQFTLAYPNSTPSTKTWCFWGAGIYPGQLTTGPNRGRWNDPHNAQLVYHYILLRSLASLVAALPQDDPDLARAREALVLGLAVRNAEIINHGAANPETVLEVLSRIQLEPRLDTLSKDCGVVAAYDVVFRFASGHYRHPSASFPPRRVGARFGSAYEIAAPFKASRQHSSTGIRQPALRSWGV